MITKTKWQAALVLVALLALNGCKNDAVAPHDDPPTLTEYDTAFQVGIVAQAAMLVAPVMLNSEVPVKDTAEIVTFDNADGIVGTAYMDYFLGGANGEASSSELADYAHLYTNEGAGLMFEGEDFGVEVSLGFDLGGDIDQDNNAAVINGGGYFSSGPIMSTFAINGMAVDTQSDYPNAGTIVFAGLFYEVIAFCDGTFQAILMVTNGSSYTLNLDTGEVALMAPSF